MTIDNKFSDMTQMLVETSPALIEIWDSEMNFVDCNQRMLDMFNLSSKEEYVARYLEFTPELQPCGTPTSIKGVEYSRRVVQEGNVRYEWMRTKPNGDPLPVEIISYRVEDGDRTLIVSYNHDLTPVKAAMDATREKVIAERIRVMFDAAPIMIEFWDTDFEGIDCNQAVLDYYGYLDKEEFCERLRDDFFAWREWNEYLRGIFKIGKGSFEIADRKPDGRVSYWEVDAVRTIYNDEIVVVTYSRNITQLKELQREQQRMTIAQESNRAKTRFLARMSHEIRTPITAVLGISEIQLRSQDVPAHLREAFFKIHDSAGILLGIVNDILDFSRIESGKLTVANKEYEVASLVNDAAQIHTVYVEHKNIGFEVSIDENMPANLIGDELRIRQIMNNLLSNAFKYTETGTVSLAIACEEVRESFAVLVITIKDTGLGMSSDQLAALKKPHSEYMRFHEQGDIAAGGTGLGIPIVLSLVYMMNAVFDIESTPGIGTTVTVRIPQIIKGTKLLGKELAKSIQNLDLGIEARELMFVAEQMPHGRVLIVDDVEANLYVARGLLGFYDLEIDTCHNGRAAINKVKKGNVYDIIFMDHMMPVLDGMETMRILRDMGYTHPIVALTANALVGIEEEFIRNGFDSFVSKPIQAERLNAVLNKYIKNSQPPPEESDNFMNDPQVADTLKLTFLRDQKDTYSALVRAQSTGDIKTAHLLAHSLKGAAALIGESDLSQAAAEVESKYRESELPPQTLLKYIGEELEKVLTRISSTDPAPTSAPDPSKNSISDVEREALFMRLRELLSQYNADCLEMLDDLRTIPGCDVLASQIENFDFALALETLNNIPNGD